MVVIGGYAAATSTGPAASASTRLAVAAASSDDGRSGFTSPHWKICFGWSIEATTMQFRDKTGFFHQLLLY